MRKEFRGEVFKKKIILTILAFLTLFVILGEFDTFDAAMKKQASASVSVAEHGKKVDDEVRKEITDIELNYGGYRALADRFLSASGMKSLLIPVILVLLIILLSFTVVEILIRKINKDQKNKK